MLERAQHFLQLCILMLSSASLILRVFLFWFWACITTTTTMTKLFLESRNYKIVVLNVYKHSTNFVISKFRKFSFKLRDAQIFQEYLHNTDNVCLWTVGRRYLKLSSDDRDDIAYANDPLSLLTMFYGKQLTFKVSRVSLMEFHKL